MTGVDGGVAVDAYVDDAGRRFEYVHRRHAGSRGLAIHFSAFFGKWGDAKPYRESFQGYFHRLKMLGSAPAHDWLFLCDAYGAFGNGTYYLGERGDLFVERATLAIIDDVTTGRYRHDEIVTVGSSMGATAALKFGLLRDVAGVVAIVPHVDLDTSARMQHREAEVAFVCPDGDWAAPHNHPLTRQIRALVDERPPGRPLPRLFVQSMADDAGVHEEQVLPLVSAWRRGGGDVALDVRPHGGHTSDHATAALLLDVVGRLLRDEAVDVGAYQRDARFAGTPTVPPLRHRVRGRLGALRRRYRSIANRS